VFGENLEEKRALQHYITTRYQNMTLTRESLLVPKRSSIMKNARDNQALLSSMTPELIAYARLVSSESTISK